jgi:radical SAM protein with 4Fe4S-binding SPASM domain
MSRIGIGEISLVIVLLLILAPDVLPKLMRKLGHYVALLRKLSQDVQDQIGIPTVGETSVAGRPKHGPRGRQNGTAENPYGISSAEKLRTLDFLHRDYRPQLAEQALRLAVDDDPYVGERARNVLMLDPLFAFERRRFQQVDGEPDRPLSHLEQFFSAERIACLSDVLNGIPDDRLDLHMESLCRLPGIESLDPARVFAGSKEALKDRFLRLCARFEEERYPPQISVAPSYRCNVSCPYCFTHALDRKFPHELTAAEFADVLDRVRAPAPLRRVGLLGGEPTLSDHMGGYVEELEKRNLFFYFATNGLTPTPSFRRIVRSNRLEMITFHIEKDGFYTEGQIDTLRANIAAVNQDRVTIVLRYNLSDKDCRDWSFLQKYMRMLARPGVSFAVVFPSRTDSNSGVSLLELEAFRPKILAFIRSLAEEMEGRPSTIAFAKPYPLCLFDARELQTLLRNTRLKNVCEIDRNNATNNICVNADRSFFPCMALNSEEFRFPDIGEFDSLKKRYQETIRTVVKTPLLPQCRECLLHARGVCQAACYAYI